MLEETCSLLQSMVNKIIKMPYNESVFKLSKISTALVRIVADEMKFLP